MLLHIHITPAILIFLIVIKEIYATIDPVHKQVSNTATRKGSLWTDVLTSAIDPVTHTF